MPRSAHPGQNSQLDIDQDEFGDSAPSTAYRAPASGLLYRTTRFSSVDLLAFHTTPKVLIPAPGPGKAILLPGAAVMGAYHFGGTAYTVTGTPSELLWTYDGVAQAPGDGGLGDWFYVNFVGLVDQTADKVQFGTLDGLWNRIFTVNRSVVENKAVVGLMYSGSVLTLGNGTLDVTTPYLVVDLP